MLMGDRWVRVADDALDSVVAVEQYDGEILLGRGTGVVVREDGYILTNAHVVDGYALDGASIPDLWVRFRDDRRFLATVVYADRKVDVAVVQCNCTGEPYVKPARRPLRVGQEIMAIGHSRSLTWSVTTGVVSALRGDETVTWLQSTAPINPGCSGGPLLDAWGRLVGITVAYTPSYKGVFWGIPTGELLTAIGPIDELHLIDIPFTPEPIGGG
jgi:S1-C subfamily serine protease